MSYINLEEEFEDCRSARIYLVHKNYDKALEIFCKMLETVTAQEESYPYVLMEYATCLVESTFYTAEQEALQAFRTAIRTENTQIDEDTEYAWNCLENCRVSFEILNDTVALIKVHKYLGDILCFNNEFEKAIEEYKKAESYCIENEELAEIYEDIAEAYKNMNKEKEGEEYLKRSKKYREEI
ncbi:hypothetical protein NUSPORA_02387 [Nucleospora cyclopteri]